MTTFPAASVKAVDATQRIIRARNLNLYYDNGNFHALKNVNVEIARNKITAMIGPSGCGKSTLLRVFNRMNDLVDGVKVSGEVLIRDKNIYSSQVDLLELRKNVGMVFQRPNPFPLSIYENIVFGLKIHHLGAKKKSEQLQIVEESLKAVLLWEELKDKLDKQATSLSLEQQQKLCIARLAAIRPEILLMDEPCSALDPLSTARIEELMQELKKNYTIVIVTHNMQQAARVSDETGFMLLGELIEFGNTDKIFIKPDNIQTENYITGRFG